MSGSQQPSYPYDCQNYKPKEKPKEIVVEASIIGGVIVIRAVNSQIKIFGNCNYIQHDGPKNIIHFDC